MRVENREACVCQFVENSIIHYSRLGPLIDFNKTSFFFSVKIVELIAKSL